MSGKETKIERLERLLRQEREKQKRREIRERAESARRARSLETRQKILIGGMVLARIESGRIPISSADLLAMLAEDLTRAHDRAACDRPPLQSAREQPAYDPPEQPEYQPQETGNGY